MIPASAIVKIAPAARPYAEELVRQMAESDIMANRRRASMFLGQIHHESSGFKRVRESLSYSAKRMAEVWPGRYAVNPSARMKDRMPNARAKAIAGNPEALANDTYGGRMGNNLPGDGWKHIGRGLKMVTGKKNYQAFSRFWLGDDSLLSNPERLEQPDGAVASAVWFWVTNGLNEVADRGGVEEVTKVVNGGQIGIVDRIAWTQAYADAWQEKPDFSRVISGANTVPRDS